MLFLYRDSGQSILLKVNGKVIAEVELRKTISKGKAVIGIEAPGFVIIEKKEEQK